MHVPRAEARILTAVESARGKLNAREGREPTVRELAQAVGVEPGLLGEMLAARDRCAAQTVRWTYRRPPLPAKALRIGCC